MATPKQKKAIVKVVENGGNVSKAMRDAGYSPATAKNPQKLTESQAFRIYMEKAGVTDEKLVGVLKDGLEATKTIVMGSEDSSFVDIQPDHPTRHKYLETAIKIKGLNNNDGTTVNINFNKVVEDDRTAFGI